MTFPGCVFFNISVYINGLFLDESFEYLFPGLEDKLTPMCPSLMPLNCLLVAHEREESLVPNFQSPSADCVAFSKL